MHPEIQGGSAHQRASSGAHKVEMATLGAHAGTGLQRGGRRGALSNLQGAACAPVTICSERVMRTNSMSAARPCLAQNAFNPVCTSQRTALAPPRMPRLFVALRTAAPPALTLQLAWGPLSHKLWGWEAHCVLTAGGQAGGRLRF